MSPHRILGPGITLSMALIAVPLAAQMHHVDKPEQVTRAIGVYEWTGDLTKPDASRLIPVSLFVNGHFEDAGVYLAQPIPLALETGNVYNIQRSGDTIGTLDLDFARDVVDKRSSSDDNPLGAWYGYGRYLPLSAQPVPKLHPSAHISAIASSSDKDDDQPHFINRSPDDNTSTTAANSSPASTSNPAPADDPDRPTMKRRSGSDSTSTDNAPSSPGTNSSGTATNTGDTGTVPDDDPDRPTLRHRDAPPDQKQKKSKNDGGYVEPMNTSLNDDPDRPEIHRGKVQSLSAPPALTGVPTNLHQAIAVSDATDRPAHVFARDWTSLTEHADTLAALQKIAQPVVQQYLATNHLTPTTASATGTGPALVTPKPTSSTSTSSAKPATTKSSAASHSTAHRSTSTPKPVLLPFQNELVSGFTLSYGGLPTFVYTASLPTTTGTLVRVTVVAQRLPSGELQTSLSSVTDDAHLDRTPWMRLVDAVDPDASHRASLLFELRAGSSRQFALYSLASAQAQQTFVTGIIE
jgi:hypothetical protein